MDVHEDHMDHVSASLLQDALRLRWEYLVRQFPHRDRSDLLAWVDDELSSAIQAQCGPVRAEGDDAS